MESSTKRTQALDLILWVMRLIGLWHWPPAAEGDTRLLAFLKRNYRYLQHLPTTFTFIGLMWLEALTSTNLEQAGQVLYMSLTEMALIVKILNIWYRSASVWQLMQRLQHAPDYELRTQDESRCWQMAQTAFKWRSYTYILTSFGVVSSACIGVLFQKDYEMPFGYFVPFEWRRNERNYWFAYGYCVLCMTMTCISNITLDTIGCYFLFHLSLLYRLLGMRFQALKTVNNEADFRRKLREIFKLHDSIRRITLQCEQLVSPYILSQIILSAFIICFSGYRLQHVGIRAHPGQFISMLQFVVVVILQIFLPCYYGNEVSFYAQELSNEVYNTNWIQCGPKTRKLLIAYMEHLKRPVKIRAGFFFEIGLPIFVKTINNAYTFFALLLNVSK